MSFVHKTFIFIELIILDIVNIKIRIIIIPILNYL